MAQRSDWICSAIVPLLVLSWSLGLCGLYIHTLDLSDLPGPGGTQLIRDIATGIPSLGLSSRAGMALLPLTEGDPIRAARMLSILSSVAAAMGAMLVTTAISGREAGAWAGLLTAAWAPTACMGWSLGSGTLAWGTTWLGLGVCGWACAHRDARVQVLGAAAGAVIALLGSAVKSTAIPALLFLPLAPLMAQSNWRHRGWLGVSVALGAGAGLGLGMLSATSGEPFLLAPSSPSLAHILPAAQGTSPLDGAAGVLELAQRGLPQGTFVVALAVALIGVLVPGERRGLRGTFFIAAVVAVGAVGVVTGPLLLPRYLIPASLGLVVLSGTALQAWSGSPSIRLAWRGLATGALVIVVMDGIAFASAWSEQRAEFITVADHRLPAVPAIVADRYDSMSRGVFMESSQAGVIGLMQLVQSQDGQPLAMVPLRDRRETHAHVTAITSGTPFSILRTDSCCTSKTHRLVCVGELIDAIDTGGIRLVIPDDYEGMPPEEQRFAQGLRAAAAFRQMRHARIPGFDTWLGSGSGGGILCQAGRW